MTAVSLAVVLASAARADDYTDMQFAPAELMGCKFKEDKGWDDLEALTTRFNKWAKKNGSDYTYWIFTPRFHETNSLDFAWVSSWSSDTDPRSFR